MNCMILINPALTENCFSFLLASVSATDPQIEAPASIKTYDLHPRFVLGTQFAVDYFQIAMFYLHLCACIL